MLGGTIESHFQTTDQKRLVLHSILLVLITLIWLNEIGYGGINFIPLMVLEVFLIRKAYGEEKPAVGEAETVEKV